MRVIRPGLIAALSLIGVVAVAGPLIPSAAHPRTSPAVGAAPQTTNPRIRPPQLPAIPWSRQPSRNQLERAYADRALRMEYNGWTVLRCTVRADGNLDGCQILEEEPRGYEFGRGALSLRSRYQVDLSTPQGQALVGQVVLFVVNFDVLN